MEKYGLALKIGGAAIASLGKLLLSKRLVGAFVLYKASASSGAAIDE